MRGSVQLLFDSALAEQLEQAPHMDVPMFLAMKNVPVQSNEVAQQIMERLIARYDDTIGQTFQADDWIFERTEVRHPEWFLYNTGHLFSEEYLVFE